MTTPDLAEVPGLLASANRILVRHRVLDAYGHVSIRHPDDPDRFLISRNLAPESVTEDDIQEFSLVGRTEDDRRSYLEVFIHSEIYAHRPDVQAVVHSHAASVVPFSVSTAPMPCVSHMAGFLAAGVPVFEMRNKFGTGTDLLITDPDQGRALAEALGEASVGLLRGHGAVIVGGSLPEAVHRAVFTVFNAQVCIDASGLPGDITSLSPEEGEAAMQSNRPQIRRAWELWLQQDHDA